MAEIKDFKGYRLIIVDCKEKKIIVDEMITAFVGGYVKVADEPAGKYDAMSLIMTRCSVANAVTCADAAEGAVHKFRENSLVESPGFMSKIKKMLRKFIEEDEE